MKNAARPDEEEHLTVNECAKEARVTPRTIRNHIAKGALVRVRPGPAGRLLIRRADFERYLRW